MRKAILMATLLVPLVMPPLVRAQTNRTIQVRQQTRLELSCENGSIQIRTWDQPVIQLRATHDPDVLIEVEEGPRVITIHAVTPRDKKRDAAVAYNMMVPRAMDLELSAVNAPITVEGAGGRVAANNVRGTVEVRGGSARVEASSVEGGVTIIDARGIVEATTVNAGVVIRNVSGRVEATTVNGGLQLAGVDSRSVEATTVNGGVVYEGTIHADGVYSFSSHNGPLTITVPQGTNADVSVSTFGGAFSAGFPVSFRQVHGDKSFQFELGTGGAHIELNSFNGTIRLKRPGER